MRYNIKVENIEKVSILLHAVGAVESLIGTKVNFIKNNNDFFIFSFQNENNCPFSLWIEKSAGEHIFLNIGLPEKEVAIFHYWKITSKESVEQIREYINTFLNSDIIETSIFCRNRLKRINYKVCVNMDEFSYLHESYFICIKKVVKERRYQRWIN